VIIAKLLVKLERGIIMLWLEIGMSEAVKYVTFGVIQFLKHYLFFKSLECIKWLIVVDLL